MRPQDPLLNFADAFHRLDLLILPSYACDNDFRSRLKLRPHMQLLERHMSQLIGSRNRMTEMKPTTKFLAPAPHAQSRLPVAKRTTTSRLTESSDASFLSCRTRQ